MKREVEDLSPMECELISRFATRVIVENNLTQQEVETARQIRKKISNGKETACLEAC